MSSQLRAGHATAILVAAILAATFLADFATPRGVAHSAFYVVAVLIAISSRIQHLPVVTAAVATLLSIIGYAVSPMVSGPWWVGPVNRAISAFAVWAVALAGTQRNRALAAERTQREWWETTLASVGDAVIATDPRGVVVYLNAVAQQLTGWPAGDAIGQPLERVFAIVNEQSGLPESNPALRALQERRIVTVGNYTVLVDRCGRRIAIGGTASPIRSGSGEVAGAVLIFRDVSAQRDAVRDQQRSLEIARAQTMALLESDRQKDVFLGVLGHEMRQPLTAASAAAQVLTRAATSDAQRRPLDIIARQLAHLARLVEDLTDTARIKQGKLRLAKSVVDARAIVAAAIETVRPSIAERNQQLQIDEPDDAVYVDADSGRLKQIIVNLLANASTHTPVQGAIAVTLARQHSSAVIRVRDTGTGISSGFLPHVFELFAQGDHGDRSGLGIGLALVKGLTELHGGTVSVTSSSNGTEFTIQIPLRTSSPVEASN